MTLFGRKFVGLTLLKEEPPSVASPGRQAEQERKRGHKPSSGDGQDQQPKEPSPQTTEKPSEVLQTALAIAVILGDYVMIASGIVFAILLCQTDFLAPSIAGLPADFIPKQFKLILIVAAVMVWRFRGRELYTYRNLLAPSKIWHKLITALLFWLAMFFGLSLIVHTNPPIPWRLDFLAALMIYSLLFAWRFAVSRLIRLPAFSLRLRRRLIVIGGGSQALRIQRALGGDSDMDFVGWVQAIKPNHIADLDAFRLGPLHELRNILRRQSIDIAVLVESESLQREGVVAVANACEIEHVQFKMVPHFFEILISTIRPEKIGEMQLLGADCLPLDGLRNRFVKRSIDIVGAMVGLFISTPLMFIFGALVYLESPGPIFYRQVRQGRNGRLFHIFKLRSMRVNAEHDGKAKWAKADDNRRLRIGTFMRKWNIDEVPQFWNVLWGQMSLVGPRPERPELIAHFKSKIPHYQVRHMYQPGMTGWAQVNGWRGNTCLEERIRHDIWYLENWTVWLDFRIMMQTFSKQKNAY